jgi:AcrR family transcriptional regulator
MARLSKENRTNRPAARLRRPAKVVAERPAVRRRRATGEAPYHHGDLHDALLQAAERVLERDGIAGLTLRAVAREAGVSHAAPTHHFGDLTGLLSELAAIGFRRFNAAMIAARASETHPLMKAMANAKAYVAYAQAHPGMYSLMFRSERLDMTRPSLHEAATASFQGLAPAGRKRVFRRRSPARRWTLCRSNRRRRSRATGRWCMASPCCCSTDGWATSCIGCLRAPRRSSCWTR